MESGCILGFRICWWRDVLHFPEDVQHFEKAVLGRSSRSRSENTAKVAEDDSWNTEKDKGTNSDEDKDDEDEDEAPKKRAVSFYVLIHRAASIMIYETSSDWRSDAKEEC